MPIAARRIWFIVMHQLQTEPRVRHEPGTWEDVQPRHIPALSFERNAEVIPHLPSESCGILNPERRWTDATTPGAHRRRHQLSLQRPLMFKHAPCKQIYHFWNSIPIQLHQVRLRRGLGWRRSFSNLRRSYYTMITHHTEGRARAPRRMANRGPSRALLLRE